MSEKVPEQINVNGKWTLRDSNMHVCVLAQNNATVNS